MNITELDNGFYLGRDQKKLVKMIHEYLHYETNGEFDDYIMTHNPTGF